MSTNLLEEIAKEQREAANKPQPMKSDLRPIKTDGNGIPCEPCPTCRKTHFLRRQQDGARWYCSRCALPKLGDDEPLPANVETCSFGPDWSFAA